MIFWLPKLGRDLPGLYIWYTADLADIVWPVFLKLCIIIVILTIFKFEVVSSLIIVYKDVTINVLETGMFGRAFIHYKTNLFQIKCDSYLPDTSTVFNDIEVIVTNTSEHQSYVLRQITVKVMYSKENDQLRIFHFIYLIHSIIYSW